MPPGNEVHPQRTMVHSGRPRVILLGAPDARIAQLMAQIRPRLDAYWQIVGEDYRGDQNLAAWEADLVVVLGGDGSILRAAQRMGHRQLPVLGINLGKLGFLADLSLDELEHLLPEMQTGRYQVVEHLMLLCQVVHEGQVIHEQLGLNEVAVLGGPPYSILDIDLCVDSEWVTTYSCDGLIISTPVGSTAHSLSAGGPILRKDLEAFVILPISPHTLTMRPVVDSANRLFAMQVQRPHPLTSVVVDGRTLAVLAPDDRVLVQKAQSRFKLVEMPGHGYYHTLREKLGWSGRISARRSKA